MPTSTFHLKLQTLTSKIMSESRHNITWSPIESPPSLQKDDQWRQFDNSVNAVSFGFVATAILISMFLIMAIFERFLRPSTSSNSLSPAGDRRRRDLEAQIGFNGKLGYPSPQMTVYSKGVSVLMPGEHVPTFIAHPVPIPCPPERTQWPHHQQQQQQQHYTASPKPVQNLNQPVNPLINASTSGA